MQLQQRFIKMAKKYPKDIAIIDVNAKKKVTYEELLLAAIILSEKYKKFPEQNIGVMIPTSFGCMVSIIALLLAGKTPVMINYSVGAIDNVRFAQKKCNFYTTLTSKKLVEKLNLTPIEGMINVEDVLKKVNVLNKVKGLTLSKLPVATLRRLVHNGSDKDNSIILFTSGSEKEPRAVQLTHKNIMHNVIGFSKIIPNIKQESFMANLPLFHVFGITVTLWTPLLCGGRTITVANPLEYKVICRSIKKHKATVLVATPTFLFGYLKRAEKGDFDSLKLVISGADKLPRQLRNEYLKQHNIEIYEGYGATETSPVISTNYPGNSKIGTVGKPLYGTKVKIVDRESGRELRLGSEGKIMVKGNLVTAGYYNNYEETSMRIRNGWYDTGDIGCMDIDGYITHKGRLRRFVKIGGEMVSLVKVESVLEDFLPDNALCCVVDVPDMRKGSEIVAVVSNKEIETKAVHKHMKKNLPAIMVPKKYFVLDELPLMSSGKVDFRKVEDLVRKMKLDKKKR